MAQWQRGEVTECKMMEWKKQTLFAGFGLRFRHGR